MVDQTPIVIQAGLTGRKVKSFNAWKVELYGLDDEGRPILLTLFPSAVENIASLVEPAEAQREKEPTP